MADTSNSFKAKTTLSVGGKTYTYFSLPEAEKHGLADISRLPKSLKVVLENLLRFEDGRSVYPDDVRAVAAWLADKLNVRMRYVRKRPLGIGRNAQVEGGDVDGLKVLLVDDLTTDGGSKLNFARGLRAAGAVVEHVLTIFYHDVFPGAADRLAQAGLTLHPLATWADVLRSPVAERFSPQDRVEVERFLADPVAWSTRHGGRSKLSVRS